MKTFKIIFVAHHMGPLSKGKDSKCILLFGATDIDASLLLFYSPLCLSPMSITAFLHLNALTLFLIGVFFGGIDFMVFIKLRALVGRKKSIRSSDVICLTFSSLRVMNGKERNESVDGKQT